MVLSSSAKMFHGKLRIHTCRVILLTSLVWFVVDVAVLSFYSDCLGGSCKKDGEYDVLVSDGLAQGEDYEAARNEADAAETSRSGLLVFFETVVLLSGAV